MRTHQFTIRCVPPSASSQAKGAFKTPIGIRFFKKKPQKRAEASLLALLQPHVPDVPFNGPISLSMLWSFPWRKSELKRNVALGAMANDTRPDCSNIVKLAEDVMTTLGFWRDDSQVADLRVRKQWANWSGLYIVITDAPELLYAPPLELPPVNPTLL